MSRLNSPDRAAANTGRFDKISAYLDGYVDGGRLPGYLALIARDAELIYHRTYGARDVEAALPVEIDTLFRIYSMTKPITAVAMLMLYEERRFGLDDNVSTYLPQFASLRVFDGGDADSYRTRAPTREMTIRDLFTHTSGLTYGFVGDHAVDTLYQRENVLGGTLTELIDKAARLPLVFSPGERWNYSIATDVLGYLVEQLSGQSFEQFCEQRVFAPLGMRDTFATVSPPLLDRFAALYEYQSDVDGDDSFKRADPATSKRFLEPGDYPMGGGGFVSTANDYLRFCQMLLNGGTRDGVRLLDDATVALMTQNHLPGGRDLAAMGMPVFSETPYAGIGFGLGVSVVVDADANQMAGNVGEYAWGGFASTAFWVDPVERLIVIFLTQLIPSSAYPIRRDLRRLVYQSIKQEKALRRRH